MNADKLLNIVVRLARQTLGIRTHLKFFSFLLVGLCSIGFFGHTFFIFVEILTSPLAKSESYEKLAKISLPDFIICLETDLSQLDEYEKVAYLIDSKFQFATSNKFSIFVAYRQLSGPNYVQFDVRKDFRSFHNLRQELKFGHSESRALESEWL